ncbi:hypothetical protein [Synechococcus elongatus]|uniref:hypothetical protein n=1 Tax=Synechococcus elongatus TaxID=32046 RepID=UPI001374A1A7|nr:hypothetical protein [Synechococcus elongatus]
MSATFLVLWGRHSAMGGSVLAVGYGNRFEIPPPPTLTPETGKLLVVMGSNTAIEALLS